MPSSSSNERIRLVVLLVVLAALAGYAVTSWSGVFGKGAGPTAGVAAAGNCPAASAPPVATIGRGRLLGLRAGLRRMVSFDRGLRPYEQGPIPSGAAWSDVEPGTRAALPPDALQPGGYELRWWMSNGDDVVADGMVFADGATAHEFVVAAVSAGCRTAGFADSTHVPPGGRNLSWSNPDGFAQEDVFLQRGPLVYRVSVVRAGAGKSVTAAVRDEAFTVVDGLACALPGANCPLRGSPTLTAS